MPMLCPTCRKNVAPRPENKAFPFCKQRCKMVDLGNWLGESYVLSRPLDPEADAEVVTQIINELEEKI